ncbi:MAG: Uncharacterised protein [Cellulomonadaceae bacterium TMED98]|nr:MAG: Uncharacterised protein [Cellulomonadaceae bacterium TMED98]
MGFGKRLLETVLEIFLRVFKFFWSDVASTNQRFGVEGADTALGFNEVVHQRLGHRRVITLVVAASAVADEVNDDIGLEFLSIEER